MPGRDSRYAFLIPVLDDWPAVVRLLTELDAQMRAHSGDVEVVLVDDGSRDVPIELLGALTLPSVTRFSVLRLRRNLGHQRAIAIGLCHLEATVRCSFVIVMDGDGEDRPEDVPRLLATAEAGTSPRVVFAERTRRSEGLAFTLAYAAYRWLHLVLTGVRVRVGNFSVVPQPLLPRIVSISDLWNHYAAAIFKARLPYTTVPTARGVRYAGASHMNVTALVTHGLSAIAAFGDRVGVRLLGASVVLGALLAGVSLAAVGLRLASVIEIPAWAPYALGVVVLLLFQMLAVSLAFVFIVLAGRDSSTFLPMRDYRYYILDVQPVREDHADA